MGTLGSRDNKSILTSVRVSWDKEVWRGTDWLARAGYMLALRSLSSQSRHFIVLRPGWLI